MKSGSVSKKKRRYVEFRGFVEDDFKYLWAAYRAGALDALDPAFMEDMSAQEFKELVIAILGHGSLTAWTMVAETPRDIRPVGIVLGWCMGRIISVWRMIKFPWASSRNILESTSNAFDTVRKTVYDEALDINDPQRYIVALAYTEFRDKKFYEKIENMKIIRKVGQIYDMQPTGTSILFQTRSPVRRA